MNEKITTLALQKARGKVATPIIVRASPEKYDEIYDALSIWPVKKIELFSMIALTLPNQFLKPLAEIEGVEKIYYDKPMYTPEFGYPYAEMEISGAIPRPKLIDRFLSQRIGGRGITKREWVPTSESRQYIGAGRADELGLTGKGVKIAVLDTGAELWHPQLNYKADKENITKETIDSSGHGDHCLTTILGNKWIPIAGLECLGVAPGAEGLAVKVLSTPLGMGSTSNVLKGMETAYNWGAKIISMSLGSEECESTEPNCVGCASCEAVNQLADAGVIMAIANGNCLPKNTIIYTNPNGPIHINEIKPGDSVYSFEGKIVDMPSGRRPKKVFIGRLITNKVKKVINNGKKPIFKLKTRTRTIYATENHPFLVLDKKKIGRRNYDYNFIWKPLKKLKDDTVVILKKLPETNEKSIDEKLAYLMGLFIGDGWMRIRNRNRGEVSLAIYKNHIHYGKIIQTIRDLGYEPHTDSRGIHIYSIKLARELESFDLNKSSLKKTIPSIIFSAHRNIKQSFIEGYIDSDAYLLTSVNCYGKRTVQEWRFNSPNKILLEQIRYLLISMGVRATSIREIIKKNHHIFNGHKTYYYDDYISSAFSAYPKSKKTAHSIYNQHIPRGFENEFFGLEKIKEIEYVRDDEVFDIEVENAHNFIADGIIVHNSGPDEKTVGCPGCAEGAISVGAWDSRKNEIAEFSSRGPTHDGRIKPEICAPGVNIYSGTSYGSLCDLLDKLSNGVTSISGTSMATPHVAGLLTLVVEMFREQGYDVNPANIKSIFSRYGIEKNNISGHGVINFDWFTLKQRPILEVRE